MALTYKLDASIFSAKNDNTLTLANANVDFALVKVEVPKHFEGLGKALSKQRLENAERGPQHRTARRLGALFEQVIPNVDTLVAAYGERVSEIATSSKLNLKATEYGPFAGHVGVDGTSIYAAASSGNSVIALHLLACMLARMFSNAEATAIWTQLVECRLGEIEQKSDRSQLQGLAALYAADHARQIMRDDLAAWDASARAWLDVANQVKKREDTQLKLIIKNIPSIKSSDTYANVMDNWVVAMTTIQKSIQGVPQDISNASVLLGLMSWHIYPDLNVFPPNRYVEFHDHLVKPGGVITLGLDYRGDEGTGVSWSVSLSHLRFYGDPVVIKRSSREDSDRLTAQELRFVSFGCVLSSWANPATVNIKDTAECFVALGKCLALDSAPENSAYGSPLGWLTPLIDAAKDFLSSVDEERDNALYFIEFGRRCGSNFLDGNLVGTIPMFGLVNPYLLNKVSNWFNNQETDVEASIAFLRDLAKDCGFHGDDSIIISRPRCSARNLTHNDTVVYEGNVEFVSAIALPRFTGKRSQNGELRATQGHKRWIHIDRTKDPSLQRYLDHMENEDPSSVLGLTFHSYGEESQGILPMSCDCNQGSRGCDQGCSCLVQGFKCTSMCSCVFDFTGLEKSLRCSNIRPCRPESENLDEDCSWLSVRSILDISDRLGSPFRWHDPPNAFIGRYAELLKATTSPEGDQGPDGDPLMNYQGCKPNVRVDPRHPHDSYRVNSVGLDVRFQPVEVSDRVGLFLSDRASIDIQSFDLPRLTKVFESGIINGGLLKIHLSEVPWVGIPDYSTSLKGKFKFSEVFFTSLKAMSAITELYCDWPDATIPISVTKRPLGLAYWTAHLGKNLMSVNDMSQVLRSTKFSCLAMLESGGHNIHPDQLEQVMALATGNSIYAAESLLQDPLREDKSGQRKFKGIRRILGSLGYPGIVMLIPPPTPLVLPVDSSKTRLYANTFDGAPRDFFGQTSLHLKFTKLMVPLASAKGAIDADVVMREALIQVYDGSRWVADLDVLRTFASPNLIRLRGCECERSDNSEDLGRSLTNQLGDELKSIEKWDELLVCKKNLIVGEIGTVRTHGNWYARLAATALATWMGCPTVILPSHCICSKCGERLISGRPWVMPQRNNFPELLIV